MFFRRRIERHPIAMIVHPVNDRLPSFPVFNDDTLKSVVDRYFKMYPTEGAAIIEEIKDLDDRKGWSKEKSIMLMAKIPSIVYYAMMHLDETFWKKDNFSNMRAFRQLCPYLSSEAKL